MEQVETLGMWDATEGDLDEKSESVRELLRAA